MTDKKEPGMAYNMKTLNKVFALLSLALLLTTFWVFLDDFIRPWKGVQIKAQQIKRQKLQEKLEAEQKAIDQEKLTKLESDLEKANKAVESKNKEIQEIEGKLSKVKKLISGETITNGQLNSFVAAYTFEWELANEHGGSKAKKLFKKLRDYKAKFADSKERMKTYESEEKTLNKQKESLRKEVTNTKKAIKKMVGTKDLLNLALNKTKTFENPVWLLRNSPMVDFMDPTLKIQQVVVPQVPDDRYFVKVPKVDRCMTCHTFIDQKGYEDQPNPFKTHPKLDLMVGMKSPHPMKKWGCTSCHGGEGHRTLDFSAPAHTPDNEEEKKLWVKKYNWHAPHKIPEKMLRLKDSEASCIKCHKGVEYVVGGTRINEGKKHMEKFGCYGCHKIEGWEHKLKPGPSLEKVASKVSKEFFKNWVWSPKSFSEHARMPSYFGQVNNSKPEFMNKNIAEVNAMAEYVWSKSKNYDPNLRYRGGNAEKGKELISEIGCMACHGVEGLEEKSEQIGAVRGPYLKGTGSKVSGDWLVSWLVKPSHYQEDTIMPSFRLSKKEANDIAAYLLSLKNETFEALRFEKMDGNTRDDILLTYLTAFDTEEVAKKKLANMSEREKTLELGHRSIGKYGCYSCHNIDGFDNRGPIGPELTNVGSKPVTQLGFGHQKIDHTREAWFYAHIKNPRRWDIGTDKPFKDLNRMPNFYMSDQEAEEITTYLVGLVNTFVPLEGMARLEGHDKLASEGFKVIHNKHCIGCHKVNDMYGYITAAYEDDLNMGPPYLKTQGHRVQADWFYDFLGNVKPIRPWINIRMPSYNLTTEEKNLIVSYFKNYDKVHTFVEVPNRVNWEPGEKAAAKQLWESYGCVTCHTGGFTREEASAPNLHYAKTRLRPSWIKEWLLNPQSIIPYTPMPNFFEDGEAQDDEILDGDVQKQVDALTKLIIDFGYDRYAKPLGAGNE